MIGLLKSERVLGGGWDLLYENQCHEADSNADADADADADAFKGNYLGSGTR